MIRPALESLVRSSTVSRRAQSLGRKQRPNLDQLEARQLLALTPISVHIAPPPVAGTQFTAVVGKFTDPDGNTDPTKYTATITWNTGKTTAGTVTVDPGGGFDVNGTFTYGASGAIRLAVKVDDTDGDTVTWKSTNVIGHAPINAAGVAIHATKGQVLKNVVVATFTDGNANIALGALAASINWGDGHSSVGTVVKVQNGGFQVEGTHTYANAGNFSVKVAIHDGGPNGIASKFYVQSNLISDGKVAADRTDANLVNPWGIVASSGSPWWDANNGTGTSELFDGPGNPSAGLPKVTIPAPTAGDTSAPTGIVFNNTTANPNTFVVHNTDNSKSGASVFLFATEDGTIAGWSPTVSSNNTTPSTQAFIGVDNSAAGAIYKGLALMTVPAGTLLPAGEYAFATNFHSGNIDVFDSGFHAVTLPAGAFQDPTLPAGYAPFGIQSLNGNIYVTYAKQDGDKHDDVAGAGHGYVDVYNPAGYLIQRLGGPGVQNELNSPWGITQAPADFGKFSNDILVGNFGDSHLSAFNPTTGAFVGQLNNATGQPVVLTGGLPGPNTKGLWGIGFGNGGNSGATNVLYFASGINAEADGMFGSLTFSTGGAATATTQATITNKAKVASHALTSGGSGGTGSASLGSALATIPTETSNPGTSGGTIKPIQQTGGPLTLGRVRPTVLGAFHPRHHG